MYIAVSIDLDTSLSILYSVTYMHSDTVYKTIMYMYKAGIKLGIFTNLYKALRKTQPEGLTVY